MIANGNHEDCAVCGTKLEYTCIDAGYLGDTDVATCEECEARYAEGWIQGPSPWEDANVPKMQLAYLKEVAKLCITPSIRDAEKFILEQLGR